MLILTRRIGESINIGDDILVTILGVKGNTVRIRTATPELLILTRKLGEDINISNDIIVTILSIKGMQVRLGITAPRSIQVHREEIYLRIQAEKAKLATKMV